MLSKLHNGVNIVKRENSLKKYVVKTVLQIVLVIPLTCHNIVCKTVKCFMGNTHFISTLNQTYSVQFVKNLYIVNISPCFMNILET